MSKRKRSIIGLVIGFSVGLTVGLVFCFNDPSGPFLPLIGAFFGIYLAGIGSDNDPGTHDDYMWS